MLVDSGRRSDYYLCLWIVEDRRTITCACGYWKTKGLLPVLVDSGRQKDYYLCLWIVAEGGCYLCL